MQRRLRKFPSYTLALLASALAYAANPMLASAQCFDFETGFSPPGMGGTPGLVTVAAQTVADLGQGPALYVGGRFGSAGSANAKHVARWNGVSFESLLAPSSPGFVNPGALEVVRALEAFDDGSGTALYVGGQFLSVDGVVCNNIAKWNGSSWSALGAGLESVWPTGAPYVEDLVVWNDGSGSKLYVAGRFSHAGGQSIPGIACWNGTSWSAVGPPMGSHARALALHQGELVVSGYFDVASGAPDDAILRWNGSSFGTFGAGLTYTPRALLSFDNGSGPALYAGCGLPIGAPKSNLVMRWTSAWSAIGAGLQFDAVEALQFFDDGGGAKLYAGGFDSGTPAVFPPRGLARWNGSSWSEVGGGVDDDVYSLAVFDGGGGPALIVGGNFMRAGTRPASAIARFDASGLDPLLVGGGRSATVDAVAIHDDGSGPALVSDDGAYNDSNGQDSIDRWTGSDWTGLGTSNGDVVCLTSFDDGGGAKLYAGGAFDGIAGVFTPGIARWDGSSWSAVGGSASGFCDIVWALTAGDVGAGPRMFAAGCFSEMGGVAGTSRIAAWDGTSWSALGTGLDYDALAVAVGVVGGAPALYAGGWFSSAGGQPAQRIARWDGSSWSALGAGLGGPAYALAIFDDGAGPALFAGGSFTSAGGAPANYVAKWDGSTWSDVGGGFDAAVVAFEVFDDGYGAALYAGGVFTQAGGAPAKRVARWKGSAWSSVSSGMNGVVHDLATFAEPGRAPSLVVSGAFTNAADVVSHRIARWSLQCPCPPVVYCTAKLNSAGCVPHVFGTGDARVVASTFRVHAADVLNNKLGLLFWSRAPDAAPFQGGFRCVATPLVRTPAQDSGGNAGPDDCSGTYSYHFKSGYFAAHALDAGAVAYTQYWSRDPASASTTGLTDALSFQVCP